MRYVAISVPLLALFLGLMAVADPAMIAREVLPRVTPLRPGRLLGFLALCVAMAITAQYELLE